MIRVSTGWHPAGRAIYGSRFLQSFDRFWPNSVDLHFYTEEPELSPRNGANRDLWSIPGARECNELYMSSLQYQGREPLPTWKESCRRSGYNFRYDCAKFWKQCLIPQAASLDMADGDILIWLDGDVETIRLIDEADILDVLGDADVCFLGREPKHSEIGFYALRLNDRTRAFLRDIAQAYITGSVLELKETHSAFVWDHHRRLSPMIQRDLTPGARGHVFPISPVGRWLDHKKGSRKAGGTRG
jgi:hypothetical protein